MTVSCGLQQPAGDFAVHCRSGNDGFAGAQGHAGVRRACFMMLDRWCVPMVSRPVCRPLDWIENNPGVCHGEYVSIIITNLYEHASVLDCIAFPEPLPGFLEPTKHPLPISLPFVLLILVKV